LNPAPNVLLVRWRSPRPERAIERFGQLGIRGERHARKLEFPSLTVEFESSSAPGAPGESHSADDRLELVLRTPVQIVERVEGAWDAPDVAAVGWATVDLERASAGFPELRFASAADEPLLGGRAIVAAVTPGLSLALLEPVTEGRLAASLARHGEGPVALYLRLFGGPSAADPGPLGAPGMSRIVDGPFGLEALQLGGPAYGPHLLAVGPAPVGEPGGRARAGTIRP
jgi:hypothetical protein